MSTPNQSYTFNAYQSNLAGPLVAGITNIVVDYIPPGLGVPAYLVIDPDVPASREYIKVLAYTNNTIENMERGLEGSAGDVDHLNGAIIRAVYTMQHLDDTFLDIEGNTTALQAHIDDNGDPHAAAGYIKESEADVRYVELTGDTMSGRLTIDNDIEFTPFAASRLISGVDGVAEFGVQTEATLPIATIRHLADGVGDGTLQVGQNSFRVFDGDNGSTKMIEVTPGAASFSANDFSLPNMSPTGVTTNIPNIWMDGAGRLFEHTNPQGITDARYLQLTGGTLTGQLLVEHNIVIDGGSTSRTLTVDREITAVVGRLTAGVSSDSGPSGFIQNSRDAVAGTYLVLRQGTFEFKDAGVDGTTVLSGGDGQVLLGSVGTEAAPALAFAPDPGTGIYRSGANRLSISTQSTERWFIGSAGDFGHASATSGAFLRGAPGGLSAPGYSFNGDTDTGVYRASTDVIGLAAGGAEVFRASTLRLYLLQAYNDTTTSVSNPLRFAAADGRIQRSTSSARYKENINPVDLADVELRAVEWDSLTDEGMHQYGFIAEEVAEALPDAGAYDEDGRAQHYDMPAVVAVLLSKIQRLESALESV